MNKLLSNKSTTGYAGVVFYGKGKYMTSVFATLTNEQGELYSATVTLGYRATIPDALVLRIGALQFIEKSAKAEIRKMSRGELRTAIVNYSEENRDQIMPLVLQLIEEREEENKKLGITKELAKESISNPETNKPKEDSHYQKFLSKKAFRLRITSIFTKHHGRKDNNYIAEEVDTALLPYFYKVAKENYYPQGDLKKSIIKAFIIPDCEGGIAEIMPVAFIPVSLVNNIIPEWMLSVIQGYLTGLIRSGFKLPFTSQTLKEAEAKGESIEVLNFLSPILSFRKLECDSTITKCKVEFIKDKGDRSIKILESPTRKNSMFETQSYDTDGDIARLIFDTFLIDDNVEYGYTFQFYNEATIGFENLIPLLNKCECE